MKILVSEKLSEHKYKTPEGYLICTDAILARTGKQSYTRDELFQDGDNTEVNVDRPYDEVMSEKTIASFENKPVTFDHPDEDVNVGNYKSYSVGYVRDVHQGKVNGQDVILGNLVITDQDAIDAIESGEHTDLSCGYDCDIKDDGNGNYAQNNIRGNHVALCKEGRAGMARIVDSKAKDAGDYSWFKGYINGNLQSFNIDSLISSVKSKRRPLHANLTGKSGNVYTVFIDGNLESDVDKGSGMWIDIVVEYPDRQQKRLISKDFNSWNECRNIFNTFKNNFRDSVDDSKVKDSNYIYEFYYNDIDNEDKRMMRKYNLEVVGKSGKERGERNLAVKGSLENLKRYAKDWLGYQLHPDYLIPESQFAYDMYDSVKDNKVEDNISAYDVEQFINEINCRKSYNVQSISNGILVKSLDGKREGLITSNVRNVDAAVIFVKKHDSEKINKTINIKQFLKDCASTSMSDVVKLLNIVDTYKKVKDADVNFLIKGKKVKTNVYNKNELDFGSIWNLGRKYNVKVEQMFRASNTDFWLITDITNKDNLFKMMHELNPALSTYSLNDIFEKALKK